LFLFPFNIFPPYDIGSYSPRGRIVLGKILKKTPDLGTVRVPQRVLKREFVGRP
jgi:hypothetical protein